MSAKTERAAAEMLSKFGITAPPVPVRDIAERLTVTVVEDRLDSDVSGMLYRQDDGPTIIAVNAAHAHVRRRFSIAHELGHLSMHPGRPVIVDHLVRGRVNLRDARSSLATSREEIDANGFAAALLMPAEWIAADVEGRAGDAAGRLVAELAKRYDVSTQAMELRLINLGYRSAP
ncbi:MAG: ImmA/IrrE family metallo-endopeptidase [Actinomycetes bacterium]